MSTAPRQRAIENTVVQELKYFPQAQCPVPSVDDRDATRKEDVMRKLHLRHAAGAPVRRIQPTQDQSGPVCWRRRPTGFGVDLDTVTATTGPIITPMPLIGRVVRERIQTLSGRMIIGLRRVCD
jgi:hypothetical protein